MEVMRSSNAPIIESVTCPSPSYRKVPETRLSGSSGNHHRPAHSADTHPDLEDYLPLLSRDYYFFPPDVSSVHKRHRLAWHLVSVVTPHEPQLDQPYTSARNSACTQEREHALLPRVDSSRSHRHSLSILSACCSSAYFHRTEGKLLPESFPA